MVWFFLCIMWVDKNNVFLFLWCLLLIDVIFFIELVFDVINCIFFGFCMNGELNLLSKKDCYWFVILFKDLGIVILKFMNFDFLRSDFICIKDFVEV